MNTANKKVVILDYGSGNVSSVFNMVRTLIENVIVSNNPSEVKSATHLILPGVGAFSAVMKQINECLPINTIKEQVIDNKVPFLGICVGMQVMAEFGFEFEQTRGLSLIKGQVTKVESHGLSLPHVGWNNLLEIDSSPLLSDITTADDFYFVHSYKFDAFHADNVKAYTDYGEKIIAVINDQNLWGVQFHPEKSQQAGRTLFNNFLRETS